MTSPRQVDVAPERLPGWLERFGKSHGDVQWSSSDGTYVVTAADGAWAQLTSWQSAGDAPPDLMRWSAPPHTVALVLLRRGGYAVGLMRHGELVRHTCGTRYVQSKTAAGGWSQQRFARRRGNQADELVRVASAKAADMFARERLDATALGGDRALIAQALERPGLDDITQLPTRAFYDIADPRFAVLQQVAERAVAVRVTVSNVA